MSEEEAQPIEGEVVTDESPGGEPGGTRTLHVYGAEDFRIEIPSEACVTFGYFNPASPKDIEGRGFAPGSGNVARQTALRIYAGPTAKTPQLACFLGASGFRDTSIKRVLVRKHVVIETNYEDDGRREDYTRNQQRLLVQANEDEEIGF